MTPAARSKLIQSLCNRHLGSLLDSTVSGWAVPPSTGLSILRPGPAFLHCIRQANRGIVPTHRIVRQVEHWARGPVNDLLLQVIQGLPDSIAPLDLLLHSVQVHKLLALHLEDVVVPVVCLDGLLQAEG